MSSYKFVNVSLESKFITYNRVKAKIESKSFKDVTLKGYVSIVQDSLVCFDFWGPLGYKVFSGEFEKKFKIIDHYNKKSNPDILSELINQSGLIFNRDCIEDVFLGRVDSLVEILTKLNNGVIKIGKDVKREKMFVSIINIARVNNIKVEIVQKRIFPGRIRVEYSDSANKWVIQFEIIAISNERKCFN